MRRFSSSSSSFVPMVVGNRSGSIMSGRMQWWPCSSSALLSSSSSSFPSSLSLSTTILSSERHQNEMSRLIHSSSYVHSAEGVLFKHVDTPENNESTPFDFTDDNYKEVKKIIAKYPKNYIQSAISPLLALAQKQHGGWVPLSAMKKIAKILSVPEMSVYEVATFYTMFNRTPIGKHHIELCTTTPCMLGGCGSTKILEAIKNHLKIDVGGKKKFIIYFQK